MSRLRLRLRFGRQGWFRLYRLSSTGRDLALGPFPSAVAARHLEGWNDAV